MLQRFNVLPKRVARTKIKRVQKAPAEIICVEEDSTSVVLPYVPIHPYDLDGTTMSPLRVVGRGLFKYQT
jgi:hypothetical protein